MTIVIVTIMTIEDLITTMAIVTIEIVAIMNVVVMTMTIITIMTIMDLIMNMAIMTIMTISDHDHHDIPKRDGPNYDHNNDDYDHKYDHNIHDDVETNRGPCCKEDFKVQIIFQK